MLFFLLRNLDPEQYPMLITANTSDEHDQIGPVTFHVDETLSLSCPLSTPFPSAGAISVVDDGQDQFVVKLAG